MIKRLTWFVGGIAAGAAGTSYVKRKVVAAADRVRPRNLATSAGGAARRAGGRVRDAVGEGVSAARRRERELRAERDGDLVRLGDYLEPDDQLLIDGETVEPARVIVLRRRDR